MQMNDTFLDEGTLSEMVTAALIHAIISAMKLLFEERWVSSDDGRLACILNTRIEGSETTYTGRAAVQSC